MTFTGYQTVEELAEVLRVCPFWLDEELQEQLGEKQLTLLGELNYFQRDLERWLANRRYAVIEAQKRFLEPLKEVTPPFEVL